jgi:hypothetical protein
MATSIAADRAGLLDWMPDPFGPGWAMEPDVMAEDGSGASAGEANCQSASFNDGLTDAAGARYRKTVIEFDALIRQYGGKTALYWLPPHGKPGGTMPPAELGRRLDQLVMSVGNEVGAYIIPIGLAFQEAYRQRPGVKLQVDYDEYHPTLAGQYLASSVVYASLYERSPVGNPYDYFGALDKDTREFVQKVAHETVRKFYGR